MPLLQHWLTFTKVLTATSKRLPESESCITNLKKEGRTQMKATKKTKLMSENPSSRQAENSSGPSPISKEVGGSIPFRLPPEFRSIELGCISLPAFRFWV
jgi:hypothetical protein